jgi:23S rRNA (cytosine1962-C5)-methyltransferase
MEVIEPTGWTDYALIDTGNREKLERFGSLTLARPEPQAVWQKSLSEKEWDRLVHARYTRQKGSRGENAKEERGSWVVKPRTPDQWNIGYSYPGMDLTFRLGLTSFGHIGIFPEQAENWKYIYNAVRNSGKPDTGITSPKILNLFAYTGGASVAARAAGAEVVHVDSVRPVVNWAREIMEASRLDGIRWVVEDALMFVRREVRRGNQYQGIVLDPPAYGRGPDGEKWVLEEAIDEMISLCSKLLDPEDGFLVLSLYSMGFSPLIAENLITNHFGSLSSCEAGEFCFSDQAGRRLPLGTFLRFTRRR